MTPMIPSNDGLDERRLGEVLRERAFGQGADLWVGRIEGNEWRAAYRFYAPAARHEGEFTGGETAVGATRREALIGLARIDEIGTFA